MGGLFCFNFLNDKVNSEQSTPIGYNGLRLYEVKGATTILQFLQTLSAPFILYSCC